MVLFNSDNISTENKMDILNALQIFDLNPDTPFVMSMLNHDGTICLWKLNCNLNDLKMFAIDLLEDSILHSIAISNEYMNQIRNENGYEVTQCTDEYEDENSDNSEYIDDDDDWDIK